MLHRNNEDRTFDVTCDVPKCQESASYEMDAYSFLGAVEQLKDEGWEPYQDSSKGRGDWSHRCPTHAANQEEEKPES